MSTIDEIKRALELCKLRPDKMNFSALELMIAAALEDAERKGAEAMRARIFAKLGAHYGDATGMHLAVARELDSIRALPMPTGGQS